MTIQNTITQLQSLNSSIQGVRAAPTRYPGSISTAQLPLCIVWPGPAQTEPLVSRAQVIKMVREYSIRVFVEALGQSDYDTPARDGVALLNRFIETYFANRILEDGYTQIVNISDSGLVSAVYGGNVSPLIYAETPYKGFVLTASIIEVIGT